MKPCNDKYVDLLGGCHICKQKAGHAGPHSCGLRTFAGECKIHWIKDPTPKQCKKPNPRKPGRKRLTCCITLSGPNWENLKKVQNWIHDALCDWQKDKESAMRGVEWT